MTVVLNKFIFIAYSATSNLVSYTTHLWPWTVYIHMAGLILQWLELRSWPIELWSPGSWSLTYSLNHSAMFASWHALGNIKQISSVTSTPITLHSLPLHDYTARKYTCTIYTDNCSAKMPGFC